MIHVRGTGEKKDQFRGDIYILVVGEHFAVRDAVRAVDAADRKRRSGVQPDAPSSAEVYIYIYIYMLRS